MDCQQSMSPRMTCHCAQAQLNPHLRGLLQAGAGHLMPGAGHALTARIIAAIQHHDGDAAEQAMRAHVRRSRLSLLAHLRLAPAQPRALTQPSGSAVL